MKFCKYCNTDKSEDQFERGRRQCRTCKNLRDKLKPCRQKDYVRNGVLKRFYGISLEDYKKMVVEQNNACLICKRENVSGPWENKLVVDHCHKTGKVRGLLCDKCNKGLGQFEDNTDYLVSAIE
jgi:hypothetical protein